MSPELRREISSRLKIAALIVGMMASTAVVVAAWPQRYWVAHRGYVEDVVKERVSPLVPSVNELTRWRIEDSIAKLDSELATWKIKLPTENDLQTRSMIQNRMDTIAKQRAILEKKSELLGK